MFRPFSIGVFLLAIAAASRWGPAARDPARARLAQTSGAGIRAIRLPRPDHTVVVIMENHSYSQIVGNLSAPYINLLRKAGANFTDSHAVSHPSEPNYLALFAGTTENLSDDSCPHTYSDPNLASGLAAAGVTFTGYSESMPSDGYTGCDGGNYARKHNPWVNFTNVSPASNLTFGRFPSDYALLPTVAFIVPNLCNDMHDCSVATGDNWLRTHMDSYVQWARSHNSLFVLTFDESDSPTNQITTIFVGPMVTPGDYGARIDHYSVLRTLDDLYGIPATGSAASASPIVGALATPTPAPTPTPTPTPTETPTPDPRLRVSPSENPHGPIVVPFRTPGRG